MMMTNTDTDQIRGTANIYAAWEAGEISPTEALRLLGDELDAMKAEFAPALKMYEDYSRLEKEAKTAGGEIIRAAGGTQSVQGRTWRLVQKSDQVVWDSAKLDDLLALLVQNGHPDIAERLADARTVKPGGSYVRVEQPNRGRA
jgi:hypothetical protein